MAQSSYQKIILTEDIELSWPFSYTGTTIICDINDVAPDANGHKIILPAANLTGPGQNFIFSNISSSNFIVVANDGTTVLATISAGEVKEFYLINANTEVGEWNTIAYSGGTGGIATITTKSSDSSLIINNSNTATISGTGGTVDFRLPESLVSFNQISNPGGFPVIISNDPFTWVTVDLVAGENIKITNPDGVDDNPVIALSDTVTGLASIEVGDLTFSGNVITSVTDGDIKLSTHESDGDGNGGNGNIYLSTHGSGKVYINNMSISADGSTITDFTSLTIGDLIFSKDIITSNVTNGSVRLNSNGSGEVYINGVSISNDGEVEGISTIKGLDSIEVGDLTFGVNLITNSKDGDIQLTTDEDSKVYINGVSISADGEIEGAKTIEVGDLTFGVNLITNSKDGDIQLATNGLGKVYINGVSISADGEIEDINIINNPYLPKAYCNFEDHITGSNNTITIKDSINVHPNVHPDPDSENGVTGSAGTYNIKFIEPFNNSDYGVIITVGSSGGALPFISNAYYTVKEIKSVTIVVTNASGELVSEVPNGVTVMIMSTN
jgi:hypothetical protein